VQSYFGGH